MEMSDDSIDARLKGIADEIKTDDMAIVKRPMIIREDDDDLKLINEYSRQIATPFKQQKLSAWQPILTVSTVIPWLIAIGVLFLPIGSILLVTSNAIQEHKIDYTYCNKTETDRCADLIENNTKAACKCSINFDLREPFDKDVFFYYALSNFYQNHRRYVRSRNDKQLLGYTPIDTSSSCSPFDRAFDERTQQQMPVAPCGAIANSLFNDTFELFYEQTVVPFLEYDISWPTDRRNKFHNPADLNELNKFTHPVNWQRYLQDYTSGNKTAFENEHLIVWMRSAALPNFRKLYARVDHTDVFKQGLPKGKYRIDIHYNFPVTQFNGRKYFILSNTSWLGGKNQFLGYAYIITGCLCIVITGVLFFIYKKYGFRERDMTQIGTNTPFIYSNLNQTT